MKKTNNKKAKTRKAIIIGAIALIVLAAAGSATYFFTNMEKTYPVTEADGQVHKLSVAELKAALDVQTIYPGISINGVDVSGKTKEDAAAIFADKPELDTPEVGIILTVDGVEYPLASSAVTIASNLSSVIDQAYSYNRTSTQAIESDALVERYQILVELSKTSKNYVTEYTADTAQIDGAVHAILDPLEIQPINAVASSFNVEDLAFVIEESKEGLDLDIDAAIAAVKASIDAKEYTKIISVTTTVLVPEISKDALASTLGFVSTTTTKTTTDPNRNTNIDLICKTIDGLVLQPGESFNFNDFIGQRTAEKGYKEAGGIFDGALRLELGGGICQANGTLYHTVMKADLQVDERHPHSWPSTYVDIGTDATVTWEGVNFQFTNNTEYPVAIHAYYGSQTVTVSIYGRPVDDGMTIEIEGLVLSRTAPGPAEYVANPLALVGTNKVERTPHDAISAQCFKVYYKDGVEVKRVLASSSSYRAITEKISVGVLAPDGVTIYAMDPATGTVILPTPVPTVPPVDPVLPSETTAETTAVAA